MALHTPVFLFLFLPVFLLTYLLAGRTNRNSALLVFSLVFFAWSEPFYFPVILGLSLLNLLFFRWMKRKPTGSRVGRQVLTLCIGINVASLLFFKLLSTYGEGWFALLAGKGIVLPAWITFLLSFSFHLPLGVSFFSFASISMLVDSYRSPEIADVSTGNMLNYLLIFPKVIAGPIVRFKDTLYQIREREWDWSGMEMGIRRFMVGFAKKTLIADQLALITDRGIFTESPSHIPLGVAWLALVSFSLQIYYDFSGYTDMAIGLGRMLGFHFMENFDYPYLSKSISEFWRRWHTSLSSWFRDYVFYPLERKRREIPFLSQSLNILIVFLLTGLWHGVTGPFIAWGLLHGLALVLERGPWGAWISKVWKPVQHVYAIGVIMLGWVFFRSPTVGYAWNLIKVLLGIIPSSSRIPYSVLPPVANLTWAALIVGILFSIPLAVPLRRELDAAAAKHPVIFAWVRNIFLLLLFIAGVAAQTSANYQPFIYGEF
jgi:alginate O-acetyltransferase complex protein AlgI